MCSFCSSWTIQKVSAFAATAVYILSSIPSNGCGGVAGSLIVARGVAKVPTALSSTHPLTIGADGVVHWMPFHHSTLSSGHSYGWYRFTKSKRSNQLYSVAIISRQLGSHAHVHVIILMFISSINTYRNSAHIICWVISYFKG